MIVERDWMKIVTNGGKIDGGKAAPSYLPELSSFPAAAGVLGDVL